MLRYDFGLGWWQEQSDRPELSWPGSRGRPANDIGAAVLSLARSALSAKAIASIETWVKTSGTSVEELNSLLVVVGWQCVGESLHRLWGDTPALRMVSDDAGAIEARARRTSFAPRARCRLRS